MIRFFLFFLRSLCILILLLLLVAAVGGPSLLNSTLLPTILASQGLTATAIEIDRLSPWTVKGTLRLGHGEHPGSLLPFRLDYQPAGLLHGQFTALTITGATVRLRQENGRLLLPGSLLPENNSQEEANQSLLPELPVTIAAIQLEDCNLQFEDQTGRIFTAIANGRFESSYTAAANGRSILQRANGRLQLNGAVAGSSEFNLEQHGQGIQLIVRGNMEPTPSLLQFLPAAGQSRIDGELLFDSTISLAPKGQWQVSADLRLRGEYQFGEIVLDNDPTTAPRLLLQADPEQVEFSLTDLTLDQPYPVQSSITGVYASGSGQLAATATLQSKLLSQPLLFELAGTVTPASSDLALTLEGDSLQAELPGNSLHLGPFLLTSRLQTGKDGPLITASASIDSLALPGSQLELRGVNSQLHYSPDPALTLPPSSVALNTLYYQGEDLGQAAAEIVFSEQNVTFSGKAVSKRNRGIELRFDGKANPEHGLQLDYTLPPARITQRSLPQLVKLPKDLTFSGILVGSGSFQLASGKTQGVANLRLSQGNLSLASSKTELAGITGELTLPFLPRIASAPSQQLKISSITVGEIKLADGLIHFRVEDENNLFIEKTRFNWCGGKVESGSLRLSLTDPELATTLYCDRLQFAELLSQFGITGAEGDGSLNGRLPLAFNGRELVFDDGFLFSTPGNNGIVRFTNTAMLRQGLPETGQTAYLDYSIQAMENFSYNWTKLTFNSMGDNLRIVMQIDGKPANPLPFGYRNGQLVPHSAGQGIQHPLRLDVNFNLPFAQMFSFGQKLQKKMKR